ncbi:MAG: hypothetical protein PHT54_02940 [Candidatus Nanoarchaeia archaeon]|nr:hypothetical protein [Candidatus Nanoarchaeia archaeon]
MKLIILFLVLLPCVYSLAVSPAGFYDKYDGYFVLYNDNYFKTGYVFSSDIDISFSPRDIELEPSNFTKINFLVKDKQKGNHKIYVKENIEDNGLILENGLAINLIFNGTEEIKIINESVTKGFLAGVYSSEARIGLLKLDSVFVNEGSLVEAFSEAEVYYNNNLVEILKSDKYLVEYKKVIPVYYNITEEGYYFFKIKVNYNGFETDEKVINLDVKEEKKPVNYSLFLFIGLLFFVIILGVIVRFLKR